MAARARRTRFAASFVVVVGGAAGCSHGSVGDVPTGSGDSPGSAHATWNVRKGSDGQCAAVPYVDCSNAPPGVTCNPPAAAHIACREPMPPDGFAVISYDGKTCLLDDGKTIVACPTYGPLTPEPDSGSGSGSAVAAFEPRRWWIRQGDHICYAQLTEGMHCPPGATCNPPAPTKVDCATYSPGSSVDELSPGVCQTLHVEGGGNCPPGLHCNPPPPKTIDVACP